MFAVLKTGGKQYRVQTGDVLRVEKLAAKAGEKVQFNDILMIGANLGSPLVAGAAVQAEVIDQIKADKVITYVKRRRKSSSQRTRGHRQQMTLIRITDLLESGGDKTDVKAAVGGRGFVVESDGRYAKNRADQAEMKKRVATGEAQEKSAEAKPKAKPAKKAAPAKEAKKDSKPAKADEAPGSRPANLLDGAREGGADDLKKISGVGPKLESLLNENGVYHFDQIAAWTADEVDYMNSKLSFSGRIERENWIEQAKELAEGKKD